MGEARSEELETLLGFLEGFIADPGSVGGDFPFGGLGGTVLGAELVDFAFDAAFREPDHGIDEAREFVGVGEEAFAERGRIGFDQDLCTLWLQRGRRG